MSRLNSLEFSRYLRMDFKDVINKFDEKIIVETQFGYLCFCTVFTANTDISLESSKGKQSYGFEIILKHKICAKKIALKL